MWYTSLRNDKMGERKMKTTSETKRESRHGKHNPDSVLLGAHVTPEQKALAQITSADMGTDVSSLIIEGVRYYATKRGILKNGDVVQKFRDLLVSTADVIRDERDKRRANAQTQKAR